MIRSAAELKRLCQSEIPEEYHRATEDQISDRVCLEVIKKFPEIRDWLPDNPTISLNILYILADDKNKSVRWRVAQSEKLDYHLFDKLSRDIHDGVRHRIACNPKVPLDILERLTHDEWDVLAEDAKEILQKRLQSSETTETP